MSDLPLTDLSDISVHHDTNRSPYYYNFNCRYQDVPYFVNLERIDKKWTAHYVTHRADSCAFTHDYGIDPTRGKNCAYMRKYVEANMDAVRDWIKAERTAKGIEVKKYY